ncbi:uncharacterized protein LOC123866669 [Maniola jurtina]|uniref:uncharacterized protein LOC123866669 n=1 Tax=Maniola jurtina TaxID=191418 RepID=UPI001E68D95B|nr:uncharacterized protein LOC123866669 [Maniola jurtina]
MTWVEVVIFYAYEMMLLVYIVFILDDFVSADQSFNYEKLNNYGLGKPIIYKIRNFGYPYPEELPTKKPSPYVRSPYRSVYQGARNKGDRRVYNKNFQYSPKNSGHHLYCEGVFDCTLSHVAVETNGSIPIILRGGVGYKYFTVIIRAEPFVQLAGRVRAYCRRAASSHEHLTKFRKFRRYL